MNKKKVSISLGNSKMGLIPSVSLPPIITCVPGCPCADKCYAAKLCRIYPSVRAAYNRNLEILKNDIEDYFAQVKAAAAMSKYFRYHVSGDIPDRDYLLHMIQLAKELPGTTFLAFTKMYDLINSYVDEGGVIPENLQILFSEWPGLPMNNPHNFPVAHVIFKGTEPEIDWLICGGNCSECACRGVGCWQLHYGQHIAFYEH